MKHLQIRDQKERIKFKKNEVQKKCLKFVLKAENMSLFTRLILTKKLSKIGKDTQIRNRCAITFRGRGIIRKFKTSRIFLRKILAQRLVPGYKKSVW